MKKPIIIVVMLIPIMGFSQSPSTSDLSFLIGQWEVERIYSPTTPDERILNGTLSCVWSLDSTFIECTYEIPRPGKKRGLDRVFFNYNSIHDTYESTWLSSTWPIKVIMNGGKESQGESTSFLYTAEFLIQDNLTEFVKSEWSVPANSSSFTRKTLIRTSADPEDQWFHHMTENVVLKND